MTNKKVYVTSKRQKYSEQFKEQALERANRDGVPKAAQDLGIAAAMIYSWKKNDVLKQAFPLKIKSSRILK